MMESISQVFDSIAERAPNQLCMIYLGKEYTYAMLTNAIDHLAAALVDLGISKGDHAILFLPNLPQWIIAWLALQEIGAIAVPITPFYGPADLEYIANDSRAETIFCLDTNFGYVTRIRSSTKLKRVIVTTMVEVLPRWKQWLGRALDKVPKGTVRYDENTFRFSRLLAKNGGSSARGESSSGDETAEMLYTGGTTGHPKGVPISHALYLEAMREQRHAGEALVPRGQDVFIQSAPLYHILGQIVGIGGLMSGDRMILLPRLNLDAIFDHIQRYRAKTFFGVPSIFHMVLEHDRLDQYDLSSLQYCFSGGDVLPLDIARRWEKKFGRPIYQGYGATETCGGISLTPSGAPFPPSTVGKIIPFQKVKVVDPITLEPIADGQSGELLVASQHMVRGYWNKPEETARAFVQLDGLLYYRTGDIARFDPAGWLFYVDRSADVIKHKGYRVAAARVEAVLQEHPAVTACCVVGIPDETLGERIKAFVVLQSDVKGITAYDLITWCRDRLAPHEVPHYIEFRDMLPKSKVGKLLRRELRAEERRKSGAS